MDYIGILFYQWSLWNFNNMFELNRTTETHCYPTRPMFTYDLRINVPRGKGSLAKIQQQLNITRTDISMF